MRCPDCDGRVERGEWRDQPFDYLDGDRTVRLVARVKVFACKACGFGWTDGNAEIRRQAAVDGYRATSQRA